MYFYSETTVEFEQIIDQTRQQFLEVRVYAGREGARLSLESGEGINCLMLVAHGICNVCISSRMAVRAEDAVFIPAADLENASIECETQVKFYAIYHKSVDKKGNGFEQPIVLPTAPLNSDVAGLFPLIEILVRESQRREKNWQAVCDSITDIIFMQLWRGAETKKQNHATLDESPAMAVKNYIDRNYMNKVSLSSIAKALYISESTVSHSFSAVYGCSVAKYLLTVRIEQSQYKLARTRMPISEIALSVGFGSLTTYYRNFNRVIGMSPAAYREREQRAFDETEKSTGGMSDEEHGATD